MENTFYHAKEHFQKIVKITKYIAKTHAAVICMYHEKQDCLFSKKTNLAIIINLPM